MANRGRPSKYKKEYAVQAKKLCELGATDREIARFFEVSESTLNLWKIKNPELSESLKIGKDIADRRVESSLYRRALGYEHDSVKIFQNNGEPVIVPYVQHYPPDTTAAIFWLKNRKPNEWRDIKAIEHSGGLTHRHTTDLTDDELQLIAAKGSGRASKKKRSQKQVH